MKYYTICLVSEYFGNALVIGGGTVATRKVDGLLSAGLQVTVISPALTPELHFLVDTGKISCLLRDYRHGDLREASLVIAATDDPIVNQAVWSEAQQLGRLINVVDDPRHSNFILPAVVHRGDLSIAISTGGSSPALARRLRERLENLIGVEYSLLTELLAELRPELIADFPDEDARLQAAFRVIDSDILNVIQTQGKDAALIYGREKLHQHG